MGPTFTLLTAVLMSMAAVTWLATAAFIGTAGQGGAGRWIVAVVFVVLAVIYWRLYFLRKKNSQPSGTE